MEFHTLSDETLVNRIERGQQSITDVAPAATLRVANALREAHARKVSVTVCLDVSEGPYRAGYGDREALQILSETTPPLVWSDSPGLRLAWLVVDESLIVWSPIAKLFDDPSGNSAFLPCPNAITLDNIRITEPTQEEPGPTLAECMEKALEAPESEIGVDPVESNDIESVIEALEKNPPVSVDVARKVRVFNTKFQYVEVELRGAAPSKRQLKLDSMLLNIDMPESVRALLRTHIHPYKAQSENGIDAPAFIDGQAAYNRRGEPIQYQYWKKRYDEPPRAPAPATPEALPRAVGPQPLKVGPDGRLLIPSGRAETLIGYASSTSVFGGVRTAVIGAPATDRKRCG